MSGLHNRKALRALLSEPFVQTEFKSQVKRYDERKVSRYLAWRALGRHSGVTVADLRGLTQALELWSNLPEDVDPRPAMLRDPTSSVRIALATELTDINNVSTSPGTDASHLDGFAQGGEALSDIDDIDEELLVRVNVAAAGPLVRSYVEYGATGSIVDWVRRYRPMDAVEAAFEITLARCDEAIRDRLAPYEVTSVADAITDELPRNVASIVQVKVERHLDAWSTTLTSLGDWTQGFVSLSGLDGTRYLLLSTHITLAENFRGIRTQIVRQKWYGSLAGEARLVRSQFGGREMTWKLITR